MASGDKGRHRFAQPPGRPCQGGGGRQGVSSALTALSLHQEKSLRRLRQNQHWIALETLTPDTLYEFQVRVRSQQGDRKTWSPWSEPLAFRTRPAGTSGQQGWDRAGTGRGRLGCGSAQLAGKA